MYDILAIIAIGGLAALVLALLVERHVVVLTFHSTSLCEDDVYTIRPRRVIAFVRMLEFLGYKPVSLMRLIDSSSLKSYPRCSLILSFDDGYLDNYHLLVWLLRQKIPVAIFIPTGHIGGKNVWDGGNKKMLTSERLAHLIALGAVVGSHAHEHRHLNRMTREGVKNSLRQSRRILNRYRAGGANSLAYPYGSYNNDVIQCARSQGFLLGFSTIPRSFRQFAVKSDPFQLGRLSMRRDWNRARFLVEILFVRLRGWKWLLKEVLRKRG